MYASVEIGRDNFSITGYDTGSEPGALPGADPVHILYYMENLTETYHYVISHTFSAETIHSVRHYSVSRV